MSALRLAAAALAVATFLAVILAGCDDAPSTPIAFCLDGCNDPITGCNWLCLNPVTGKEDPTIYDTMHEVNGVCDPCHCFDPGGPSKECPHLYPWLDGGSD